MAPRISDLPEDPEAPDGPSLYANPLSPLYKGRVMGFRTSQERAAILRYRPLNTNLR